MKVPLLMIVSSFKRSGRCNLLQGQHRRSEAACPRYWQLWCLPDAGMQLLLPRKNPGLPKGAHRRAHPSSVSSPQPASLLKHMSNICFKTESSAQGKRIVRSGGNRSLREPRWVVVSAKPSCYHRIQRSETHVTRWENLKPFAIVLKAFISEANQTLPAQPENQTQRSPYKMRSEGC